MTLFLKKTPEVQLQLLTSTVKLFLKKPATGPQILIQNVLHQATIETDNPDLRDRAFVYWRLLSSDPESAKDVVLAMKPTIRDDLTNSPQNRVVARLLKAAKHAELSLSQTPAIIRSARSLANTPPVRAKW